MRMFFRGVSLDQQKSSTVEKRLRKLLKPEHYNDTIVCLDPENETIMQTLTPQVLEDVSVGCEVIDKSDGEALALKLRRFAEDHSSVLVIDAIDDEPYVSSALAVVQSKQKAFLMAVECMRRAYGFEKVILLTYGRGVYTSLKLPRNCGVTWKKLRCRYPAHIRVRSMYASRTGRYAIVGAEAMLHLYRALFNAKVHDSVIVTVAGTAVGSPCNVEVSAGTPVSSLLDLCGLTCPPSVLVRGGAMTGYAMMSADEPVQVTDNAFLAFAEQVRKRQYECVGCGRCARVCPRGLMPDTLYKNASAGVYEACDYLKIGECIECGCCSYICPSNIDILSYLRKAKQVLDDRAQVALPRAEHVEYGIGEYDFEAVLRRQGLDDAPDPESGEPEPPQPPHSFHWSNPFGGFKSDPKPAADQKPEKPAAPEAFSAEEPEDRVDDWKTSFVNEKDFDPVGTSRKPLNVDDFFRDWEKKATPSKDSGKNSGSDRGEV